MIELDNLSLTRCREVSKTWKSFLDQQKFLNIRCIQSYIEKRHKIGEPWKNFLKNSSTEMIILLNSAVKDVYSNIPGGKKVILYPLRVRPLAKAACHQLPEVTGEAQLATHHPHVT